MSLTSCKSFSRVGNYSITSILKTITSSRVNPSEQVNQKVMGKHDIPRYSRHLNLIEWDLRL